MYKKGIFNFLFTLATALLIISCEKDDVCVDGDTPLLQISFIDFTDNTLEKEVPSLRVVGQGQNTTVDTFDDRTNATALEIPLKVDAATTTFFLVNQSATDTNDNETGNIDTVTFTYEVELIYVSRACGYIANYKNLSAAITPDADNWIQNIEISSTTVADNATVHVEILH